MDEFRNMLRAVVRQYNQEQPDGFKRTGHMPSRMEMDAFGEEVRVVFANDRHQDIAIERENAYYVLTSIVIGQKRVQDMGTEVLLPWLWNRNIETDVVVFTFDREGRLVGRIEQLAQTMDLEEVRFYIELLARECDQLEYLLSGVDVQ